MTAPSDFPPLPRATKREADDGLDALEVQQWGAAVSAPADFFGQPSVVISPEAEIPLQPADPRPTKAAQEPTLVIRDRRKVANLRAELSRQASRSATQRYKSALFWACAGLGAFSLGGGLVALLGHGLTPASASTEQLPTPVVQATLAGLPTPAATAVSPVAQAASAPQAADVALQPVPSPPSPAASSEVAAEQAPSSLPAAELAPRVVPRVVSLEDLPAE